MIVKKTGNLNSSLIVLSNIFKLGKRVAKIKYSKLYALPMDLKIPKAQKKKERLASTSLVFRWVMHIQLTILFTFNYYGIGLF